MAVTITAVERGSVADKKRICAGDRLVSVNGQPIVDVLDYRFYLAEEKLTLVLETKKGNRTVRLRKPEYEDIGLEFETYLMDKQHTCRNQCVFCFIDQMPKGLRDSLYFKDDDSRLSFLFGNYITLTNLTQHEIDRIIALHISPVNISVHTTNPELRFKMMNNRFAGETLGLLKKFADADIKMCCQLVLCPEWNDGEELARSMRDLAALAPAVESVAVVPVGLTKYRDGLTPLRPFTKGEAERVLAMVESFGDTCLETLGTRLVYPADEWYLKAERAIPEAEFYEEMSQLENGVGMTALLRAQFEEALELCDDDEVDTADTVLVTGVAAAPIIEDLVQRAKERFSRLRVRVVAVKNRFFGETITVAGLVTGQDIAEQLAGVTCERVLIPDVMLRHERDRFLDDMTPEALEETLGVPVMVIGSDGDSLVEALRGE